MSLTRYAAHYLEGSSDALVEPSTLVLAVDVLAPSKIGSGSVTVALESPIVLTTVIPTPGVTVSLSPSTLAVAVTIPTPGVNFNTVFAETITLSANYNGMLQDKGALSHWPLQETEGTTAEDIIGSHNGTYLNPSLGHSGPHADVTSIRADESPERNVRITSHADFLNTQSHSVMIWAKNDNSNPGNTEYPIAKTSDWRLLWYTGEPHGWIINTGSTAYLDAQASYSAANSWRLYLQTFNSTSEELRLYIDGNYEGNDTPPGSGTLKLTGTSDIIIGARDAGGGTTSFRWNGYLAHAAFFDRVLTDNDVSQLYYSLGNERIPAPTIINEQAVVQPPVISLKVTFRQPCVRSTGAIRTYHTPSITSVTNTNEVSSPDITVSTPSTINDGDYIIAILSIAGYDAPLQWGNLPYMSSVGTWWDTHAPPVPANRIASRALINTPTIYADNIIAVAPSTIQTKVTVNGGRLWNGWTLINWPGGDGISQSITVLMGAWIRYVKDASSEPSSYTWELQHTYEGDARTIDPFKICGQMIAISNLDPRFETYNYIEVGEFPYQYPTPVSDWEHVIVSGGSLISDQWNPNCPSYTTSAEKEMVIVGYSMGDPFLSDELTVPSGYTEIDQHVQNTTGIGTAYKIVNGAGTTEDTSNLEWDRIYSSDYVMYSFGLLPLVKDVTILADHICLGLDFNEPEIHLDLTIEMEAEIPTPVIQADLTVEPTVIALDAVFENPNLVFGTYGQTEPFVFELAIPAPDVWVGSSVTPNTITLTAVTLAPTLNLTEQAPVITITATIHIPTPYVDVLGRAQINPSSFIPIWDGAVLEEV